MPEAPMFFLPGAKPGSEEETYANLAGVCRADVPDPDKRIYSIEYVHDGVDWTATVGETLQGVERRTVRRKGQRTETTTSHGDSATVRAIFAGIPYTVVTDGDRTRWANPFLAGEPRRVTYFSPTTRKAPEK